ncbi:MAG: glycosyltransferase family 2 protein [Acidobacteria bacterium ACB1]|nr:Undecaprenyl-phosphate 4-deoxy-4-formamido-L-arabinose transferase [Pyrinomonadaceae bacterium]MCE7961145.1 glycosyltransferase family 2 protein [Acidobacteria bacterium ACB1]RIJ93026.1 MAG: glycosyl transferase [Acidobacteriota bacterium]
MPKSLSIVIPAFNESERIAPGLAKILTYIRERKIDGELIVVDDGSSDDTAEVARNVASEYSDIETNVIRYEQNRGKGYAVKTGLLAARADIALFSDADLSTPIDEADKLLTPIANDEMDVTFGSRAIDRSLIGTHQPWRREQGGKVMNFVIRKMSGLDFADTQCGFKAFNMKKFRPLLDVMTVDRFGFDVEFLFVAKYHGLRLAEIPVRWNDVAGSKVSVFRDTRRMFSELAQVRRNAKNGLYDLK